MTESREFFGWIQTARSTNIHSLLTSLNRVEHGQKSLLERFRWTYLWHFLSDHVMSSPWPELSRTRPWQSPSLIICVSAHSFLLSLFLSLLQTMLPHPLPAALIHKSQNWTTRPIVGSIDIPSTRPHRSRIFVSVFAFLYQSSLDWLQPSNHWHKCCFKRKRDCHRSIRSISCGMVCQRFFLRCLKTSSAFVNVFWTVCDCRWYKGQTRFSVYKHRIFQHEEVVLLLWRMTRGMSGFGTC